MSWIISQKQKYVSPLQAQSRREILLGGAIASQALLVPQASAEDSVLSQLMAPQAASSDLESGLLESRVLSNVLNPPPYGMEGTDVFYPS